MLINHFCLELEEEVEQKLINARLGVEDVSEEWLQAQLLLRAFGRPGEEVRRTKLDMISSLEIINAILEDKYYIRPLEHLLELFHNLEEVWAKAYPEHPASENYFKNKTRHNASQCWCFAAQQKNLLIEKTLPATVTKSKPNASQAARPAPETQAANDANVLQAPAVYKRPLPDAEDLGEASGGLHKRQKLPSPTPESDIDNTEHPLSSIEQTPGAPPTPPEHVDHLPLPVAVPVKREVSSTQELAVSVPQSESPLWRAILDEHSRTRLHRYMTQIAGTYMVQCPLLETRHPDLVGQLNIVIKYIGAPSTTSGILEAYINFGKFVGPAVLGLDDPHLTEYLWATAKERRGQRGPTDYVNAEVERLREAALDLAGQRTPAQKKTNLKTRNLRDIPALEIDTSELPDLCFDARLDNPTGEYYDSGTYRIAQGGIEFSESGLCFGGTIRLPESAGGELKFNGVKVFNKHRGDLPQKWEDVPTSKVLPMEDAPS
ncbi:uncharacterized protein J4E79_007426 [Alternaria viburni]|uniref:uncharacterized protein n=1 Tax=Alternaria viburni TaxID=566460 RepID=UPI0020C354C3|nr:uncharacterized protein J4E79_007426 [Alternaria viburni]KAI4657353.1 hypothetical protein J4E79_007426 [Alternaria viburni]